MSTDQPAYQPRHAVKILRKLAVEGQLQDYVCPDDAYQGKHRGQ